MRFTALTTASFSSGQDVTRHRRLESFMQGVSGASWRLAAAATGLASVMCMRGFDRVTVASAALTTVPTLLQTLSAHMLSTNLRKNYFDSIVGTAVTPQEPKRPYQLAGIAVAFVLPLAVAASVMHAGPKVMGHYMPTSPASSTPSTTPPQIAPPTRVDATPTKPALKTAQNILVYKAA
jgi:hypothetical protein